MNVNKEPQRRWILESVLIQNTTKKIDYLLISVCLLRASLVAQIVKNLPAIQETLVCSLGRKDPLEKKTATHSSTLAWRIPWTESLAGYSPWGRKGSDMTE